MAYLRLRKDLRERPAPPHWPEGITPALLDENNAKAAHGLLADAFMDFPPRERWYPALLADSEYAPELCVVAVSKSGEVAGYVQCWTSDFVKDLVVAPAYRGSGIGEALIRHVFATFVRRGTTAVDLKVEIDALPARRLYSRLGMVVVDG